MLLRKRNAKVGVGIHERFGPFSVILTELFCVVRIPEAHMLTSYFIDSLQRFQRVQSTKKRSTQIE